MNGWITAGLVIAASLATGWAVADFKQAKHDRMVADLRRDAALTLAQETNRVLERERDAHAKLTELELTYAQLQNERAVAGAESVRLSGRLDDALKRLRDLARTGGGSGDGALPAGGAGAQRCEELQAALGRAVAAVERLKSGGDAVAELGQQAVDVATIAAQAAAQESGHE